MDPIDWQNLARRLGSVKETLPDGRQEHGGPALGREALELIIGSERFAAAVDYYLSGQPGFELARSVLWLLHPWAAMQRCREVFDSDAPIELRRSAIELLRVVADARVLPWVVDFLADDDHEIQIWGIGMLDQLLLSKLIEPEDAAQILAPAKKHHNAEVVCAATEIAESLAARGDR